MRIFKSRLFHRWMRKEGFADERLLVVADELQRGLVDANLGGHIYKKRVAIGNKGKSGGLRTLLAYRKDDKVFFIYGFAKSSLANIEEDELKALKKYAMELLEYSDDQLRKLIVTGALIEVMQHEKDDT